MRQTKKLPILLKCGDFVGHRQTKDEYLGTPLITRVMLFPAVSQGAAVIGTAPATGPPLRWRLGESELNVNPCNWPADELIEIRIAVNKLKWASKILTLMMVFNRNRAHIFTSKRS